VTPDLWTEALAFVLDAFKIGVVLGLVAALVLS
jgi:hypothetical protein